jgi:hypothetical protein
MRVYYRSGGLYMYVYEKRGYSVRSVYFILFQILMLCERVPRALSMCWLCMGNAIVRDEFLGENKFTCDVLSARVWGEWSGTYGMVSSALISEGTMMKCLYERCFGLKWPMYYTLSNGIRGHVLRQDTVVVVGALSLTIPNKRPRASRHSREVHTDSDNPGNAWLHSTESSLCNIPEHAFLMQASS